MKKNMGGMDKFLRLIVAVTFLMLYLLGIISGTLGIVLLVLAAVFLLTSFISSCPLYIPFGINTRTKELEKN